jgi:hypothetical protein
MPVTSGSFEEQPRWAGNDVDIEFRAAQGQYVDDEDVVVAACTPSDYEGRADPHNGGIDDEGEKE